MKIPQYKKHYGWLRFFAGLAVGAFVGWTFFLGEYGQAHDRLLTEITKQRLTIEDQQDRIDRLVNEQNAEDAENEKKLTIQKIEVMFTNAEELNLSQLNVYELRQLALKEVADLEGVDIDTAANVETLLDRAIENKRYELDDKSFRLKVEKVYMTTTLKLELEITEEPPS
ncbi:sporulation membrane protein YtrI [Shouchella shacheensis]|uniref:sporulation membrane protein YtrI n=1 Tax=Shouchella shacheensis TaxID=1649580 RepID=UPI0007404D92|nr:sporulation membrane protein YtrI [Shouchella shacheensis]